MTTLRISITKEVLEATKDCRIGNSMATSCAIANAIIMIWPKAEVHRTYIYPFGTFTDISFPHSQERFIDTFDNFQPHQRAAMQPFSFEIEVPDEVIGEVNIEEIRRICEGSKTLELVK